MKTRNFFAVALAAIALLTQSCEDDFNRISGEGPIVTETLSVPGFTSIELTGVDNVHISYGPEQRVEVTGHRNIISRIQRRVVNDTWYMELEDGNYGRYELTYYLTLPYIDYVACTGTADIYIDSPFNQDQLTVFLEGTGSFYGFSFTTRSCRVDITGTGNCQVTATEWLDVILEGTGNVYYKGYPHIDVDISGKGSVVDAND